LQLWKRIKTLPASYYKQGLTLSSNVVMSCEFKRANFRPIKKHAQDSLEENACIEQW
jgi:hypothetical protein